MLPELDEIAVRRRALKISQDKLAKMVGVSRSLIGKLETNNVKDVGYSKVKKIFETLEELEAEMGSKTKFTAGEIHNKKVEYADDSETAYVVWKRMDKNAYSQLPVRDFAGDIVGSITEKAISRKLSELDSPEKLRHIQVKEFMEDPFPTVSIKAPLAQLISLLQNSQAVITQEKGKPKGIITNADLINSIAKVTR